jgi:hypothetical protein
LTLHWQSLARGVVSSLRRFVLFDLDFEPYYCIMNKLKTTIEQKLGDHPNVDSSENVQPDSGIGKGANQGDGPYEVRQ